MSLLPCSLLTYISVLILRLSGHLLIHSSRTAKQKTKALSMTGILLSCLSCEQIISSFKFNFMSFKSSMETFRADLLQAEREEQEGSEEK